MTTRSIICCFALLTLSACVSPVIVNSRQEPELAQIRETFAACVERAHADPEVRWVHGWAGNSAIEARPDGSIMGYCYEWQELVHDNLAEVVRGLGWDLVKVNINRDWFSEHHAVIVFDPGRISREELLVRFGPGAWVLDAWQRGRADIYTLEDWVSIPVIVFEPASLELEDGVFWRPTD